MIDDIHTLPHNDLVDHELTRTCWCQPLIQQLCPECAERSELPDFALVLAQGIQPVDCWRCGGLGVIECNDLGRPAVIIHNAADGRE